MQVAVLEALEVVVVVVVVVVGVAILLAVRSSRCKCLSK